MFNVSMEKVVPSMLLHQHCSVAYSDVSMGVQLCWVFVHSSKGSSLPKHTSGASNGIHVDNTVLYDVILWDPNRVVISYGLPVA